MRAEFDAITSGFSLFPTLTGFANKAFVVNGSGTAVTTTVGSLALAGDLTTTGAFALSLTVGAAVTLTLPVVSGTLATLAGTETLTEKTINLTSNTLSGTTAQFNTALSDDDFATLTNSVTLTNKTLSAPNFSGTATGSLTSLALTTPVFSGTATGTYTLGGTPTIPTYLPLSGGTLTGPLITSDGVLVKEFPAGTVMLFVQTSAPTGWTKGATHDNKALRVVTGTASTGGSVAFTTAFAAGAIPSVTGSHVLSTGEIPAHNHVEVGSGVGGGEVLMSASSGLSSGGNTTTGNSTSNTGGGGGHTHTIAGQSLAVNYVDVIIATKD